MKPFLFLSITVLTITFMTSAQNKNKEYTHTVVFEVNAFNDSIFDILSQLHLDSSLFGTRGLIKKVQNSSLVDGVWGQLKSKRKVSFTNGSFIYQSISDYEKGKYLAYELSGFKGLMKWLTVEGSETWKFNSLDGNRTQIIWSYRFRRRSLITSLVLNGFVKHDIKPMMEESVVLIQSKFK